MLRVVLDSEIELANSATMGWLQTASDAEVVMYAKSALQRICLLCQKPGHLAAQCLNGCRHCGAKPDKATGWALHKPACLMKQQGSRSFRTGQKGAGGKYRPDAAPPPRTLGRQRQQQTKPPARDSTRTFKPRDPRRQTKPASGSGGGRTYSAEDVEGTEAAKRQAAEEAAAQLDGDDS